MSTGSQFRTPDYFAEIACIFCFRQIRLFHVRLFEKELSIDLLYKENHKGPGTSYESTLRLQNVFKKFTFFTISYLTKF